MKKIISLVLALMLSVTALTAFASPTPQILEIDTQNTESKTDGIKILGNVDKSKSLADLLTNARKKTNNVGNMDLGKPIVFVNNANEKIDNPELGKNMSNYSIVPFVQYSIDPSVTAEIGKFLTPINNTVKEFLLDNMNNVRYFYIYEMDDEIRMHEVQEWYIIATGKNTYGILSFIPMSILKDAEGRPACLDFEIVK